MVYSLVTCVVYCLRVRQCWGFVSLVLLEVWLDELHRVVPAELPVGLVLHHSREGVLEDVAARAARVADAHCL